MMPRGLLLLTMVPAMLIAAGPAKALESIEACFMAESGQGKLVTLEVARARADRQKGLMGREHLPPEHGMLFIYPSVRSPQKGFWMYNTLIPLDIAYIDASQRIAKIRSMPPCDSKKTSDCPTYPAGVPFQYAVEMNTGYFEENRVNTGHRLIWEKPLPSACQSGKSDH